MSYLKILIVSTKGGVGKSTIAMQLIAPYLYEKNEFKAIKYYECDDMNKDIHSYGATSLIDRALVDISSPLLREELFEIVSSQEFTCIDVGGNNTAKLVLDKLSESGGFEFIDLVLIPVLDGEQDMINALDTYKNIKNINENIKIMFVLNRVKEMAFVEEQFDHFFGDSRGIFKNFLCAKDYINDEEFSLYLSLVDSDIIKFSRRFGLSVYEIAKMNKDYLENILEHSDPKIASFKHFMSLSCKRYDYDVLSKNFIILDSKIEGVISCKRA